MGRSEKILSTFRSIPPIGPPRSDTVLRTGEEGEGKKVKHTQREQHQ